MTENERLTMDEIIQHCNRTCENTEMLAIARGQNQEDITSKGYWEHYQVAKYLEELKQYRAIGTVEEIENSFKKTINAFEKANPLIKSALDILQEYQSIGTIEEFKDLKEKNTPKKPFGGMYDWTCPTCGTYHSTHGKCCSECMQMILWD